MRASSYQPVLGKKRETIVTPQFQSYHLLNSGAKILVFYSQFGICHYIDFIFLGFAAAERFVSRKFRTPLFLT